MKPKFSYLIFLLFSIIIVSGCVDSTNTKTDNVSNTQTQQIICNKPYILVGTSCCLDKNNNSICDNDEDKEANTTTDIERTKICNEIANSPELKYPTKCFPIMYDITHPESIDVKSDPLCRCVIDVGTGTNTVIDVRASRFMNNKTNQ